MYNLNILNYKFQSKVKTNSKGNYYVQYKYIYSSEPYNLIYNLFCIKLVILCYHIIMFL